MKKDVLLIGGLLLLIIISACDKTETQDNQAVQEFEQEVEEAQKIEKQIEKQDEEFAFSPNSIVETQNGVSLSLDDFKYEIKGENWGKITEMTISVLNKGNRNLDPKVLVLLYDEKDSSKDKVIEKAEIEFDYLYVGEHTTKKAITNIAFDDINLPKTLKVVLVRAFDNDNRGIVVIEREFIAE